MIGLLKKEYYLMEGQMKSWLKREKSRKIHPAAGGGQPRRTLRQRLPANQPRQYQPANNRHDRATDRIPNRDIKDVIRGTGKDENKGAPPGRSQCRRQRCPEPIRGRAALNENTQRDNQRYGEGHHLPGALKAHLPVESPHKLRKTAFQGIYQPSGGED